MDEVLQGLDYTFCYLDDRLVASATVEEHVHHLAEVLGRRGLVINSKKCVLGVAEVEYLGHVVSARRIQPLPERLHAFQEFSPPETVHHLQSFLGMANFYRRFLPAAAAVLRPLTDALRGSARQKLRWSPDMETSFCAAKKLLVQAVELAHPDPDA